MKEGRKEGRLEGGLSTVRSQKEERLRVGVVYMMLYPLSNTVKLLTSQWKLTAVPYNLMSKRNKRKETHLPSE